jgi:DNA/RNA endonuclease YhcR with UshA esterase domain
VKAKGTIFRIQDKETFQVLSIKDDTGKIDVLCRPNITELQNIQVEGTVKEYGGYLQIQADKIIKKQKKFISSLVS